MIRSRLWLVIALLLGQTAALAVGIVLYQRRLTETVTETHRTQVLESNGVLARQLSSMVESQRLGPIARDSVAWHWLQSNVELISLPNDGFVCILDRDGRVLCHPRLKDDPSLVGRQMGSLTLHSPDGEALGSIMDYSQTLENGESVNGRVYFPSGAHLVGVSRVGGQGARLVVHQNEAGIAGVAAELRKRIVAVSIPLALAVLLSTGLVTWFVTRRFEHRLEGINEYLEQEVQRRTMDLTTTRDAIIFGLARLSESRDTDTGQHLLRIQGYVRLLAVQLRKSKPELREELTDEWIEDLAFSSALHDIGKVGVPDAILLKPGRLTEEEFENIKRHCWIGGDCLYAIEKRLGESNFLTLAREIAYAHHERWDGHGYPFGLPGELIPLSARIVALADAYDAMTSKRPYKKPIPHDEVVEHIRAGTGTQFDPAVTRAFLEIADRFDALRSELQDELPGTPGIAEAA
jgi:response regulator RpfG family c-di-GMP phosphodiesterase